MDGPDPDRVTRLCEKVSHVELETPRWLMRLAGVPPEIEDQFDRCARQYLLAATLYTELQPAVLLAVDGRPASVAAPHAWRAYLQAEGLHLKPVASIIRYVGLALLHGLRGVSSAVRIVAASVRGQLRSAPSSPYHVLMSLPPSLLSAGGYGRRESLVGWLADRVGDAPLWIESRRVAYGLPSNCIVTASALPRLSGGDYLRFSCGAVRALAVAFIGLLVGRPQMMLLAHDMVQLAHARSVGAGGLARSYTAENSQWIHRPLYTVWAEFVAGSKSQMLFYATNMDEALRYGTKYGAPTFLPGYQIMSWSDYLVWDNYHADLVRAWGHVHSNISVVGTIPLTDSAMPIPDLPPRSVAIFDVTPFKPARLARMGLVSAYYNATVATDFLRQCLDALLSVDGTLVLKQKRDIGNHAHFCYRLEIERLKANPRVVILDPGISAGRLVGMCDAVVSMPFSSPGLFAKDAGIPAGFFDATETIIASERQPHGLPLLRGEPALRQWLADVFALDQPSAPFGSITE